MRIAIFCETYLPFINGVVTHIKLLKEGLEEAGHEVLIVTADPATKKHSIIDGVLHCPAVPLKHFYNYGFANPFSNKRIHLLEQFNPDVCHVHQEFSIGAFGVWYASKFDKPLVYTLHTMYDDYLYYVAPQPFIPLARKALYSYSKVIANKAVALTGPSQKVADYFEHVGVNKPVNVIPNPVEFSEFSEIQVTEEETQALRTTMNLHKDDFVAIFVGRLGKEKSVDVLLDYYKTSLTPEDHIHLMVVGDGPVTEDLKKQVEELSLSDQVTFVGKVPHEKLMPYIKMADIYVTASLSDTYSISMLEGMSAGLPVVQRYDELNQDQIVNGVNGYTFKSAEEFGKVIRKLRDMPKDEFQALSSRTQDGIKNRTAAKFAKYIEVVYETAIRNAPQKKKRKRVLAKISPKKTSKKEDGNNHTGD